MTRLAFILLLLVRSCAWCPAQPVLPERYGPFPKAKALPVVKEARWYLPESLGPGMVMTSETMEPGTWTIWAQVVPPVTVVLEIAPGRPTLFFKYRADGWAGMSPPARPFTNYLLRLPPGPVETNLSCCL